MILVGEILSFQIICLSFFLKIGLSFIRNVKKTCFHVILLSSGTYPVENHRTKEEDESRRKSEPPRPTKPSRKKNPQAEMKTPPTKPKRGGVSPKPSTLEGGTDDKRKLPPIPKPRQTPPKSQSSGETISEDNRSAKGPKRSTDTKAQSGKLEEGDQRSIDKSKLEVEEATHSPPPPIEIKAGMAPTNAMSILGVNHKQYNIRGVPDRQKIIVWRANQ